jgi:hypothetical protein
MVAGCISINPVHTSGPPTIAPTAAATASVTSVPTAAATATAPSLPTPTAEPTAIATVAPTAAPTLTATSATNANATSEAALRASMLEPADVDPTAETDGVTITTDVSDLPTFSEVGGLRRAGQVFNTDDFMTVYDFRYQFPTVEAASTFLHDEEQALGETDSGAVLTDAPAQLGDDMRYYTGHIEIIIVQDSYNWLIRVGNVVAKIWVGGEPTAVNEERAMAIAQAAAAKMEEQFGS